jgi:RNA polymerase sigma-70 factor (ECF subfamily)
VQPGRRRRRPIGQELRSHAPLDYERLSDPILIRRAKDGDRRALDALCRRHRPRVERLARHVLRDPEDAQDATQEALVRLVAKLGQFRAESSFTTWLHRLTFNVCVDVAARRRAQRAEPLGEDERIAPGPSPSRAAELSELRAALRAELEALPGDQARVVVLKDAFGLSFEQVAAASGMPIGTAKCYAHRGRAALRLRLEEATA